jgi:hypothetical protein
MTLERDLRALGAGLPDPPELAPRVRIAVQQASARRRRRRRIAVLALALALLVPATALAVSPDLRNRVLETFGLRGVKVERVEKLPAVGPDARRLQLGSRVSLQQAQRALQLRVHPPSALGTPDAIFAEHPPTGVSVSFLYEPRTVGARLGVRKRVLVSMLRGELDEQLLGKTVARATQVRHLRIAGGQALLITGVPHLVVFFPHEGTFGQMRTRLAGPTLLWQRGALIVRVEGDLPGARLVAIARTFSTG